MITPRPYQHEAVQATLAAHAGGKQRVLIALSTGTGKTIVFALLLQQRGGRALILAHRNELIQQAVDKLRVVHPTIAVGVVKADLDEHTAPTVVASVQTLSRAHRLERLTPNFATVVIDKAHHAPADTYQRILDYCGAYAADGPLVVGVTATPERHDKLVLGDTFGTIVYQKSILEMMEAGYLCDLRAVQVLLQTNFDAVKTRHGDFVESELEEALLAANAPRYVLEAFQTHAPGRKALCFVPTVALAYAMAETFQQAGIVAEALDGTTPIADRRAMLQRLHTGTTQLVCNCGVLTEGFDEPSLDCIIMARPTQSRPLYQQMLGRGTRPYPGKAHCLILDVVGVSTQHKLQQLATLFDLPSAALQQATILEAVEADRHRTREETAVPDGRLVHSLVDLFARRPLTWVRTKHGAWVLTLGAVHGALRLVVDGAETWRVVHQRPEAEAVILQRGLSLGYAQGCAEDVARQLGAGRLLDPNARWRQEPATDKQKETLRKCRIAFAPTITKGDAGILLTQHLGDLPPQVRSIA
jgi:ATP-dependent helicase IRC3